MTFIMAKYRAIATRAFSPPESASRCVTILPGGRTEISMPEFRTSPGSVSESFAVPPPNRSRNVSTKFRLISSKRVVNRSRICFVRLSISFLSPSRDCSTSAIWFFINSYRPETSLYSSTAPTLTEPRFLISPFRTARRFFACASSSIFCFCCSSASRLVNSYSSHSWEIIPSYSF